MMKGQQDFQLYVFFFWSLLLSWLTDLTGYTLLPIQLAAALLTQKGYCQQMKWGQSSEASFCFDPAREPYCVVS